MSRSNLSEGQVMFRGVLGFIVLPATLFAIFALFLYPNWRVWAAEKRGQASFAEAEQDRRIKVTEASANAEASILQAKATIQQAEAKAEAHIKEAAGIAEANRIIGESLKNNPDYLKYLYVQQLNKGNTIYVPTGNDGIALMIGKQ